VRDFILNNSESLASFIEGGYIVIFMILAYMVIQDFQASRYKEKKKNKHAGKSIPQIMDELDDAVVSLDDKTGNAEFDEIHKNIKDAFKEYKKGDE